MKAALLFLALSVSVSAASLTFSVPLKWVFHPVASFHSSSKSLDAMLLSDSLLQVINIGDYATTHRAFSGVNAGRYCENNPLLVSAPCVIDLPRFTGIKIAVAAFGTAEWIPVWLGRRSPNYVLTMTIINFGASIPLGAAVVSNVYQLEK